MNASPSVSITADGYEAAIALRGGQLLSLTTAEPGSSDRQNLIVPAHRGAGAYSGAVLAPWPNRLAGATYTYAGTSYELEPTEESTGAALHGLLHSVECTVQYQRPNEVHLSGVIEETPGYPFRVEVILVYRLSAQIGLTVTLMARYTPPKQEETGGSSETEELQQEVTQRATAPFGAGFHPYLTAGDAPLKACRLKLPATTVAKTKSSGKVVSTRAVSGDLDLTSAPLLAGLTIDHAYTGLPEEGWSAELVHGPSGLVVRMISDTPWVQVYTGDRIQRAGVAVEPMTCPPNAFNSGKNLVELQPYQWFRVGFSLEAIRR